MNGQSARCSALTSAQASAPMVKLMPGVSPSPTGRSAKLTAASAPPSATARTARPLAPRLGRADSSSSRPAQRTARQSRTTGCSQESVVDVNALAVGIPCAKTYGVTPAAASPHASA